MSEPMMWLLVRGVWETLAMTFVSGFFGFVIGLPVGVLLYVTRPGQIIANAKLYLSLIHIYSCSQLVSSTDFSSIREGLHLRISVPSPEGTAPCCLVPSPEFSQAPWYSLPDHLCRFGVRFDVT